METNRSYTETATVTITRTRQYGEAVTILWNGDWSGITTTYNLDGVRTHGAGVPNYLRGIIALTPAIKQAIDAAVTFCADTGEAMTLEFAQNFPMADETYDEYRARFDAYLALNGESYDKEN